MILIVLYIFILIYPCYISILLYRLYSTILCILLSCCFIYALVSIFYVCLCTFIMIYRHEHIYSIHLPILSMLSSGAFLLPHTHVSTYTHILYSLYICFHATDSTIFLSHYTNYLIVFVLSRDIFYLCSIYTAKITEFVQQIICKRTKEKAWHYFQTFTYTISLYK